MSATRRTTGHRTAGRQPFIIVTGLLGSGKYGLLSFRAGDHGDRSGSELKAYVAGQLAQAGIVADGPTRLLCMPRILGYGFNPLSLYFCHRADGSLAAILYEVRNTFGEQHSYLAATAKTGASPVRQTAPKRFFVSPFMDMDLVYDFEILPPGDEIAVVGVPGEGWSQVP